MSGLERLAAVPRSFEKEIPSWRSQAGRISQTSSPIQGQFCQKLGFLERRMPKSTVNEAVPKKGDPIGFKGLLFQHVEFEDVVFENNSSLTLNN